MSIAPNPSAHRGTEAPSPSASRGAEVQGSRKYCGEFKPCFNPIGEMNQQMELLVRTEVLCQTTGGVKV